MRKQTGSHFKYKDKLLSFSQHFPEIITGLSLTVILTVFWSLKLTGITMAGDAFCGMDEHVHTDDCLKRTQLCTLEEIPSHLHSDACFEKQLIYGQTEAEAHVHTEDCFEEQKTRICELDEVPAHVHTEACTAAVYLCETEESEDHTHTEDCLLQKPLDACPLEETEGHVHTEECYVIESVLICKTEESEGHAHTEDCFARGTEPICGQEEIEGHTHDDSCFEVHEDCPIQEHIHTENCYSDLSADLETAENWEADLPAITDDLSPAEAILLVAQSQIGQAESELNFEVDEKLIRRGITRYGQWYGNPYGDWSAMFVSFCLHYAGFEELPANAGPESMRLEWQAEDLYGSAESFMPSIGELLFLDKDQNGAADAVAIVTDIIRNTVYAIEGDAENTVTEVSYTVGDKIILGFGRVPLDPQVEFSSPEGSKLIATTETDEETLFSSGCNLVVYFTDEAGSYALDGNGELVDILISPDGEIFTEAEVPELLLWSVCTNEDGEQVIQNLMTDMLFTEDLFAPITTFAEGDETEQGGSGNQYARAVDYSVWLDGTHGGLMAYSGSADRCYTVTGGTTFTLPTTWQSPAKYNYVVGGWYDIVNNKYYQPGEEVIINGNTVFYPDWIAATYDIGSFNADVVDTVSTNNFITTRMFDYTSLMNVLSERANVSFGNNSHTETWQLITDGSNPYNGNSTLNFILRDWDVGNQDISYPQNTNNQNNPTTAGTVYPGLYTDTIRDVFFDPELEIPGKHYLGTGDHLFQLCLDPEHEYYGYYYYDSEHNAASYNQTDQRFYVYDYLECTRTSTTSEEGRYTDFLPLNSPYANTNGKTVNRYEFGGVNNEHAGTQHYMYDCRYDTDGNSTGNVGTNFWYGMSVDINFFLPDVPGFRNADGSYGNLDIYGQDMHFRFAGDDDVWIFIDDTLILDLGGIHGMEGGNIDFATGVVTVNGVVDDAMTAVLRRLPAGEHNLTVYYLERGSSMANCEMHFNLAPRFDFSIMKEDVLTRDTLNGAEFSVYMDEDCTVPAELWTSAESHARKDPPTNTFKVIDGSAYMWGMVSNRTYYIRETKPPDNPDPNYTLYEGIPKGTIILRLDRFGAANYEVKIRDDGDGISSGFTVHGFRIDQETQKAYIVATNAPSWVQDTTTVEARKYWNDNVDHSEDSVTVYLTVTDPDGTVRRLQEAVLNESNGWHYIWKNLPKYWEDHTEENPHPIMYSVEESYSPGYYSEVTDAKDGYNTQKVELSHTTALTPGETYFFGNGSGFYLSTQNYNADTGFMWVTLEEAENSPLAQWQVTFNNSNGSYNFTNLAGQTIYLYYNNGSYITDFYAASSAQTDASVSGFYYLDGPYQNSVRVFFSPTEGTSYLPLHTMTSSNKFQYTTDWNNSNILFLYPLVKQVTGIQTPAKGEHAYLITNSPLSKETSLTVTKQWDYAKLPTGTEHEKAQVTVKLFADGKDTGRTVTLTLRNGWTDTFRGLPYEDSSGRPIVYTVEEIWKNEDWLPYYGEVIASNSSPPTYSTTVTNKHRLGVGGPQLPATGSPARMLCILCGSAIMLGSLVYGIATRRKRERRIK